MKLHNLLVIIAAIAAFGMVNPLCGAAPRKVTIWVHGTRIGSFMPLGIVSTLEGLEHRVLYAPPGLHQANEIDPELYHHKIPGFISAADPARFPLKDIWVYGWSGDLDSRARQEAGLRLSTDLKPLIQKYIQQDGQPPEITFITHSHGGNVILIMSQYLTLKDLGNIPITAIMLACPVQKATEQFIKSPLFGQIYNIHSHDDIVQIIDPQAFSSLSEGTKEAFSTGSFDPLTGAIKSTLKDFGNMLSSAWEKVKKFENPLTSFSILSNREFAPQANLKQARVSWKGYAPWTSEDFAVLGKYKDTVQSIKDMLQKIVGMKDRGLVHMEFMFPLFFKRLPLTLQTTDTLWKQRSGKASDPDVAIVLQGNATPAK
jgi:hypothetical protein